MAARIPKVAVVGNCFAEISVQCEKRPESGKMVKGSSFVCRTAGAGILQATEAALCGCEVSLIGCVGKDCFGEMIKDNLARFKVHTDYVFTAEARSTGIVMTMVDELGENISCVSQGANSALTKDHIESARVEQLISESDCLLLENSLNEDVIKAAIRMAELYRVKTVLAVDMCIRQTAAKLTELPTEFMNVHILVAEPEKEGSSDNLTGSVHESKLAAAELVAGGVQCVIVRTGKKGCCVVSREGTEHINNFAADTVPLACGKDAFLGAIAACAAVGDAFDKSVNFAMAAEILASRKMSSQDSLPKKAEILELLQQIG